MAKRGLGLNDIHWHSPFKISDTQPLRQNLGSAKHNCAYFFTYTIFIFINLFSKLLLLQLRSVNKWLLRGQHATPIMLYVDNFGFRFKPTIHGCYSKVSQTSFTLKYAVVAFSMQTKIVFQSCHNPKTILQIT